MGILIVPVVFLRRVGMPARSQQVANGLTLTLNREALPLDELPSSVCSRIAHLPANFAVEAAYP